MSTTTQGRVAGKVVIVTGGSGDLGAAVIHRLVEEGATVANLDRDKPREDWRTQDWGMEDWGSDAVIDWVLDITSERKVAETVAEVVRRFGAPDVLVNAAGILGRPAPSHESTEDEFDAVFGVNVKGTWLMTKYVVPHLIAKGAGSIVNFSSVHGLTGGSNVPLYHASKGAVRLLSKADAVTYGPHGSGSTRSTPAPWTPG